MKHKTTFKLIASLTLVTSMLAATALTQSHNIPGPETAHQESRKRQMNPDAPKFALLVGINRYKASKELNPLYGSENDVNLITNLLTQDYGFDPTNVKVLKGGGAPSEKLATARNIKAGLGWLIESAAASRKAGKEAVVVFHFSGHGSQVPNQPDDKDDEPDDDRDETIVPYDSRQGDVYDIRDDELDDYYAELSAYTSNITLIFDSCYSGTVSRGDEGLIARLAPADVRPLPEFKRKYRSADSERARKMVVLSAATSYQRAYERDKRRPNEAYNGAFTYYLVQALRRASRATSYRELMQEVSAGVKSEIASGQDPQAEGNIDGYVFGSAASRAAPFIPVSDLNHEKGEITFNAGQIHGVRPGSMIAIYARGATSYVGMEGFLTNAVVKDKGVKVNTAVALLPRPAGEDEAKKIRQVNRLSKVILLSPNFGGGGLRVDLTAMKPPYANAALKDEVVNGLINLRLVESGLVKIVHGYDAKSADENDSPLLTLKTDKFRYVFPRDEMLPPLRDEKFCSPPAKPAGDEEVLYLDDGTGRALFGYYDRPNEVSAEEIVNVIDRYARQRNLLTISNKSSDLGSRIHVTLEHIPGLFTRKCDDGEIIRTFEENRRQPLRRLFDTVATEPRGATELGLGQAFQLKIKNISEQLVYITTVLVGADGSIEIVYPDGGNAVASALKPGNEALVGRRVTTPPLGVEKYIVFITARPADFSFVEVRGVRRGKSDSSMLGEILTRSGIVSGRSEVIKDSPDQWGTVGLELVVAEKTSTAGQK